MKQIQNKLLILLLLIIQIINGQNNSLSFSPSIQTVNVNSNIETTIPITVSFTSPIQSFIYTLKIEPIDIPDNGFINQTPDSSPITYVLSLSIPALRYRFKFNKNVNSPVTKIYKFKASWGEGPLWYTQNNKILEIHVTYSPCSDNLILTENVNSYGVYIRKSSNTITATNTIFNNATSEYDAGNTVFLKPSFHAKSGSNFRAYIEGCQNAKAGKKSMIEDNDIEDNDIVENILDDTKLIKIYPNPTKGILTIESSKEVQNWIITSTYGKSYFTGSATKTINMSKLPNGIYFLKAILKDGKVVMKKIIKN